jgi:predicted nucleic acid-binding protein
MSETEAASTLCFVDTNIWLYAFIAGQDAAKSAKARQLLQENATSLIVSSQVINEICVNLIRKAHVPESTLAPLIHSFYRLTLLGLAKELALIKPRSEDQVPAQDD